MIIELTILQVGSLDQAQLVVLLVSMEITNSSAVRCWLVNWELDNLIWLHSCVQQIVHCQDGQWGHLCHFPLAIEQAYSHENEKNSERKQARPRSQQNVASVAFYYPKQQIEWRNIYILIRVNNLPSSHSYISNIPLTSFSLSQILMTSLSI